MQCCGVTWPHSTTTLPWRLGWRASTLLMPPSGQSWQQKWSTATRGAAASSGRKSWTCSPGATRVHHHHAAKHAVLFPLFILTPFLFVSIFSCSFFISNSHRPSTLAYRPFYTHSCSFPAKLYRFHTDIYHFILTSTSYALTFCTSVTQPYFFFLAGEAYSSPTSYPTWINFCGVWLSVAI